MSTLTTTIDGQVVRWKDHKRYFWLFGLVVPLLPFGAARWVGDSGWAGISWYSGPIWILVMIPLLDRIFGEDRTNPPDWAVEQLSADRYYRWCTYLFLPLQYAGLVFACWIVATNDLAWWQELGYALTVGTVGGVAINTAHELGHKNVRTERMLAKVSLAQTGYGHFYVEHNRGHGEEACEAFWKLRREFSYSLRNTGLIKLNEDIVVPRGRLVDLVEFAEQLQAEFGFPVACFGHAGDGNIHVNIMVPTMDDPPVREKAEAALDRLFHQIIAWKGAITGEHGIGLAKARWYPHALPAAARAMHTALKQALDPNGILNPGKFIS